VIGFISLTRMPPTESAVLSRATVHKIIFVVLILAAVVSIPYFVPAPLSISRSYITGFSNRAAVIILFLGTGILAVFTQGRIARMENTDSRLSWRMLLFALLITLADCFHFCKKSPTMLPGGEALYFLNRLQMLAAGLVPYRQFEFVYGPLLLYPVIWAQKLLHLSLSHAYTVTWIVYWQLGVVMIWQVVRGIDFPIPSRRPVFGLLVLTQLAGASYGGLSYTPFRAYFSAFCISCTYQIWRRTRNAWLVILCSLASIVLTICCSMDQAVAVTVGLFTFMLLLVANSQREFSRLAFAVAAVGTVACFGYSSRIGLLDSLRSFGAGGYSYPLLPSPGILIALFAYMVAGCVLYRALYVRLFTSGNPDQGGPDDSLRNSIAVPLTIAGCAMLPAALGRCDLLHITAATPAFVVGVAAIYASPALRRWWIPMAFVCLFLVPRTIFRILNYAGVPTASITDPALVSQGFTKPLSDNQWYVSSVSLTAKELPCDRQYFSPSFMPDPTEKFFSACLDTGYYLGFTDVITPATIEHKVSELRNHASEPLLMENIPLEAQLPRQLGTVETLYYESETFWVPAVRHAPLTYAPIINYIRQHYIQGPTLNQDRLRIWYPNPDMAPREETQSRPLHALSKQ
jgi:hypothetical protein